MELLLYKEIIDYGDNDIHTSYPGIILARVLGLAKENIFYIAYLENYFGCGMPQQVLPAKDGGWSLSNPSCRLILNPMNLLMVLRSVKAMTTL